MKNKIIISVIAILVTISSGLFADDTELYLIDSSSATGKRPQILFIFDNSGSMNTDDQVSVSPYCSISEKAAGNCSYASGYQSYLDNYSGYINNKALYWTSSGIDNSTLPSPDQPNDARRFYSQSNNCNKSVEALAKNGQYNGYFREYQARGQSGSWEPLAQNNGLNKNQVFDCVQDIIDYDPKNPGKNNQGNSYADGYPVNTSAMYTNNAGTESRNLSYSSTSFGTGGTVTLYTPNYLVWYQWVTTTTEGKNSGTTDNKRIDVAKAALKAALESMSVPIDAGLAVFNVNSRSEGENNGGRIVSNLVEMTNTNRANLISTIYSLDPETNTPLCETLYEAYQFFSGGPVTYGNKDSNRYWSGRWRQMNYTPNTPPSIITSGNYTSPFKKCPDTAYVVYITDGAPTLDRSADANILALTASASTPADYTSFTSTNGYGQQEVNYLPALAAYMANNDVVQGVLDADGVDNKQTVKLYTIGFSAGADSAAKLLEEAAFRAGSPRNETTNISSGYFRASNGLALVEAINNIIKNILEVNTSFTSPSIASNNFDKTQTFNSAYFAMFYPGDGPRWSGNLKKLKVNGEGVIVAPGGTIKAIDTEGNISATTCTYWNTCAANSSDGNNVTSGGVLPYLRNALKNRNIKTTSGGSIIDIDSSSFVSSHSQAALDWLYGVDVDDDDKDSSFTDARADIMGDPLHSKPLALNFGTSDALDVRILLGTNQGLVHMFKDSDTGSDDYSVGNVSETWAFIPEELWSNIPTLKENIPTGNHSVYGMDLSPVAYTETNASGKIDKAWLYLGMRRGGASYYALDISNPDSPSLKWMINSTTSGFEDLGQTWSVPITTFVPGVDDPVLIFGGGMSSSDGTGEGVYIVNADTGPTELIKLFTFSDMSSIATKVSILDSDNDGVTDRIYASDISGNVWRMDLPSADKSTWTIFKFASISNSSSPNDRMFFSEPSLAQTQFNNIHSTSGVLSYQNTPYDAVAIGTGNRTHPLDTYTNDMFFVFQDRNVVTQSFSSTEAPATLVLTDLYDVTSAAPTSQAQNIVFGNKRGWYYDFTLAGEKSLSSSLIFDGKVYFTSFVPPAGGTIDYDLGVCDLSGEGRLYVLDLHKGTRTYSDLYYELGERVPDTPQIVIPKADTGNDTIAYIIGVGKGDCVGNDCKGTVVLGSGLTTNRIYYHIEE
ncbi:type IV pilin biogenesis protein [Shewanella frigidimarina]|uniref:pilus assembly protein n=1 Tax=Shewanella frigidimarina TaxID=56812 RepID=UPI000F514AE0|nr:PilC/PilY family type IV pilus protein [Shewanella frigidimarina]RPA63885.1 type IV pilin biogenesis protein [Shewanella frigidimarina]